MGWCGTISRDVDMRGGGLCTAHSCKCRDGVNPLEGNLEFVNNSTVQMGSEVDADEDPAFNSPLQ